jgi:hypothetical protein
MAEICDQAERVMLAILWVVLSYPLSFFRPRHDLALEVLALLWVAENPSRPKKQSSE